MPRVRRIKLSKYEEHNRCRGSGNKRNVMNIFCKISLCITLCDHAGTRYNTCKTSDVNVALLFSRSPSVIALFANQEYECVCVCAHVLALIAHTLIHHVKWMHFELHTYIHIKQILNNTVWVYWKSKKKVDRDWRLWLNEAFKFLSKVIFQTISISKRFMRYQNGDLAFSYGSVTVKLQVSRFFEPTLGWDKNETTKHGFLMFQILMNKGWTWKSCIVAVDGKKHFSGTLLSFHLSWYETYSVWNKTIAI